MVQLQICDAIVYHTIQETGLLIICMFTGLVIVEEWEDNKLDYWFKICLDSPKIRLLKDFCPAIKGTFIIKFKTRFPSLRKPFAGYRKQFTTIIQLNLNRNVAQEISVSNSPHKDKKTNPLNMAYAQIYSVPVLNCPLHSITTHRYLCTVRPSLRPLCSVEVAHSGSLDNGPP